MQYRAEATIAAPAEKVWAFLVDAEGYPAWEPNVTRVDGTIALGDQITVHTRLSEQAFPVTVTALEAPTLMEWTGGMPLGLFKGVRRFELVQDGDSTRIEVTEQFSGPLLFLMKRMMPDLQPAFDDFVAGLKGAAEA